MESYVNNRRPEQRDGQFSALNTLMGRYLEVIEFAAEQQKRAAEMEEAAMLDPLTGLRNRRALEETYEKLQQSHTFRRNQDQVIADQQFTHSILALDIDNFKDVNDTSGHIIGDAILKEVAESMGRRTRNRDIVSRWGGDEFTILLPRSSEENATQIAEEIRSSIESQGKVTISVGVAEIDLSKPLDENYHRADVALYEAKSTGRNQVVRHGELVTQLFE